jgi:hypothetical protein
VNSIWKDISALDVSVGDTVRVKTDAYRTAVGDIHNGRLVRITDIKDGDIHVTTIDLKLPYISGARHAAYRLEKKVVEL